MFRTGFEVQPQDIRILFVVYGAGYAAVFLTFALLYLHAWNKRRDLELTELEIMKTRHSMIDHFAMVVMGLISALLALTLPLRWVGLAGYFYFTIGVYFTVAGSLYGRRERLLKERHAATHAKGA
jgi:hypothetical protein